MNTKNLIIAFITVSIAALIVSAAAVFAAARSQYAALLTSATEKEITEESIIEAPKTSSAPETTCAPETTFEETSAPESTVLFEEITSAITSAVPEETTAPSAFMLKLEGERLVIFDPVGNKIYERIINVSSLHPKDLEALEEGIAFSEESKAMSAIYDIIS